MQMQMHLVYRSYLAVKVIKLTTCSVNLKFIVLSISHVSPVMVHLPF